MSWNCWSGYWNARGRATFIYSVAIVYEDATDVGGCYCGSATTLYFGIGLMMRDLEDDARGD